MTDIYHPEAELEWTGYSLQQLCQRSSFDEHFVTECVEHGVTQVPGSDPVAWVFTTTTILRLQRAWRLHQDLDIHINDLDFILELLEDREVLKKQVESLQKRLHQWELD
jgi:MerR HTH family regulatory protein